MKRAIITFATADRRYQLNLIRQGNLMKGLLSDDIHYFPFVDYGEISSPTHQENNYAFKVYAIEKVRAMGYTSVLWVDSAVYPVNLITPIFEYIERENLLIFDNIGYNVNDFCNEFCSNYYKIDTKEKQSMKMIMACVMGFNFLHPSANLVFDSYKTACDDGIFNGSWHDHRHDQTCMSIILYKHGLQHKIINAQSTFFAYKSHIGVLEVSKDIIFLSASN